MVLRIIQSLGSTRNCKVVLFSILCINQLSLVHSEGSEDGSKNKENPDKQNGLVISLLNFGSAPVKKDVDDVKEATKTVNEQAESRAHQITETDEVKWVGERDKDKFDEHEALNEVDDFKDRKLIKKVTTENKKDKVNGGKPIIEDEIWEEDEEADKIIFDDKKRDVDEETKIIRQEKARFNVKKTVKPTLSDKTRGEIKKTDTRKDRTMGKVRKSGKEKRRDDPRDRDIDDKREKEDHNKGTTRDKNKKQGRDEKDNGKEKSHTHGHDGERKGKDKGKRLEDDSNRSRSRSRHSSGKGHDENNRHRDDRDHDKDKEECRRLKEDISRLRKEFDEMKHNKKKIEYHCKSGIKGNTGAAGLRGKTGDTGPQGYPGVCEDSSHGNQGHSNKKGVY